jgi:transposase InsO family protein
MGHTYQELHKRVVRKFPRRQVLVHGVNETWSADLVDMSKFAKENKGYKWILTVIDVLSKYAWAVPLKNKKAETVLMAFQKVLEEAGTAPKYLWVD